MSFSRDVKAELAGQYGRSRHCQLAELAGMLELEGRWDAQTADVTLETENILLMEKYRILRQKAFGNEDGQLLEALHWDEDIFCGIPLNERRANGLLVQRTCCKRAFIRGAFMAAGSITDPSKSYHFEIVCRSVDQALQLQELMASFEADAKIVERKDRYVVYLKEGSQIVDMLNVMEAYVSLMNLENVRILKEMRNSVNRKVNCETANINKTVSAAVRQLEDIKKIRDTIGFDQLPGPLSQMAQIRLEHPDASLKELGIYADPPVGKSGVNHRLRKLSAIAEEL
ncbi:MAG: DNA-binding protein WhiA [Lachnospiraceae bacterium]|nr:DNA-binding protein WhiA [Lachnospiraceae bacterium]